MTDPTSKLRRSPSTVDPTPSIETDQSDAPGSSFDADRYADVSERSQTIAPDGYGPGQAV